MKTSRYGIKRIKIANFKSIKNCDLELSNLNVLIGANGAGKSNFFDAFQLLACIAQSRLQWYVAKQGGPDALLHFGRKRSPQMIIEVQMDTVGVVDSVWYKCVLEPTHDNLFMIAEEEFSRDDQHNLNEKGGYRETRMKGYPEKLHTVYFPFPLLAFLSIHHFQDSGDDSRMKQLHEIGDHNRLRPDGGNLAAFLHHLEKKHNASYQMIVKTIRLVAPFFRDFYLSPNVENNEMIELKWLEKDSDTPFKAHHLSDGTLRFICLAALLLQPQELKPATMIIDEPELGLHPYAINLLAGMIRSASTDTQIIVSTQSPALVGEFQAGDVIVADRTEHGTRLNRLDESALATWLDDYSLGELWNMNILGGRPSP